jgi:hypothetical protein
MHIGLMRTGFGLKLAFRAGQSYATALSKAHLVQKLLRTFWDAPFSPRASYPKTVSHFLGRAAFFTASYPKTASHFLGRAASSRD